MKSIFLFLTAMLMSIAPSNSQNEFETDDGYILTEIWNAKPSWMALSTEERKAFFQENMLPVLKGAMANGAEIIACAVNENTGSERMGYEFMAVWKFPDKKSSENLEQSAKEAGFLDYFDQVNFSGHIIPPPALDQAMVQFGRN